MDDTQSQQDLDLPDVCQDQRPRYASRSRSSAVRAVARCNGSRVPTKALPVTRHIRLGRIPSALAHAPPSPERAPSRAITHKVRTPDRLQRRFTGGRLRLLATVTVWVLCTGDSRDEPNQRLDRLPTCSGPPPTPPRGAGPPGGGPTYFVGARRYRRRSPPPPILNFVSFMTSR